MATGVNAGRLWGGYVGVEVNGADRVCKSVRRRRLLGARVRAGAATAARPSPTSTPESRRRSCAALLTSAVALAGAATSTLAQGAPPTVPASASPGQGGPVIAVSGTGEAQVTPDRARLSIGVQTQAPTAADASARNARLQRAVIDTLRALGVAAEQITTNGYNVFPEQVFDPQGRRSRITGYNVQNTVVVELRRTDQVGPALDAVLSKGANLVSSLQLYSSQEEQVRRRALQNAIERARADADAMATAAGGRLGALLELNSGPVFRPRPMNEVAMASARMADAPPTPVSEGTQTLTATVIGRWQFVPGR